MIVTSDIINTLNTAFQLIQAGTNEKVRQSEMLLMQLRGDVQYPKVLFDYLQSYEVSVGLRAAIEFKLWFKAYRNFEQYQADCVNEAVSSIKSSIVGVYMNTASPTCHQIKEAIQYIAARDYPHQWPKLIEELNQCLVTPQYVLKSLKLIRKLTEKYVYSSRSDPLYEEIIITCNVLHHNLLVLAQSLYQQLQSQSNLDQIYMILKSLLRVFYHLNYQDLHPHFEDNLQHWMEFMKLMLKIPNNQQYSSQIFKCKGEAMKCVLLYAIKYRDDFSGLIQEFSREIWEVCTQTTDDKESEKILQNALKYFKSLVTWGDMKSFFEGNIRVLMDSLIIKNLQLSKNEQYLFNDEPQQFIEIFFEQSDLDSRRAQAVDLYKTVTRTFPQAINMLLQEYIQTYIQSGMNNNDAEIILINLIIDGATTGFTTKDGTVDIQIAPEIITGFYQACLKSKFGQLYELVTSNTPVETKFSPILLCFYCRYLFYFRNFIDKTEVPSIAEIFSKMLTNKKQTLSNIACYTTNALITVKVNVKDYSNPTLYFSQCKITQPLQMILTQVYNQIKSQQQIEQHSLKLINSLITLLNADVFNALQALSDLLLDLLKKVKEAYEFSNVHIVFETIANIIDISIQTRNEEAANQLQLKLLNDLDQMLRENKGDVVNFILQIYALFIQVQTNATSYYSEISQSFYDINNWNESNSSLFIAYITYFEYWFRKSEVPAQQMLLILKNIVGHSTSSFTKLSELLIKINQQFVYEILDIAFKQYQVNLNSQQHQMSSKSKASQMSQKLISKEILLIMSYVFQNYGIALLVQECSKITPQLIDNFLLKEVLIIQSISNRQERKQIFTMITSLLFLTQSVSNMTLQAVFKAMVENIYTKKRHPLKFLVSEGEREVTSGSGFQPLKPISIAQQSNKLTQDEDRFFLSTFKQFYMDPNNQQNLPVSQLIDQQKQEFITALLQSV